MFKDFRNFIVNNFTVKILIVRLANNNRLSEKKKVTQDYLSVYIKDE